MIKRILAKLANVGRPKKQAAQSKATIYSGADYGVTADTMSRSAVSVVLGLQEAGYQAYVVGGAVRDALLGLKPKDFDVATNAKPEQVKHVFKRAYIIGKRFRIVHVVFAREVIEVTTFRGGSDAGEKDEHGRILSDNVYGSQAEDALRRDFTLNALYYNPADNTVHDFVDAMKDVATRTMRLIGEPAERYREDPVRMLRAVRLSVKTQTKLARNAASAITEFAPLMSNVPAPRLRDEALKVLLSGYAVQCIAALKKQQLLGDNLPFLDELDRLMHDSAFIKLAIDNTDARVQQGRPVTEAFLFACLLWDSVEREWAARVAEGEHSIMALQSSMDVVLDQQANALNLTRKNSGMMREIWSMQPRFDQRAQSSALRFVTHERFRAAYDFMLLRAAAGDYSEVVGVWWTAFYDADESGREDMVAAERDAMRGQTPPSDGAKRKRKRPRGRAKVGVSVET
jgi:poly(A) polymerase